MKRRTFSSLLVAAPGGLVCAKTASTVMTDPGDRKTWAWLLQRYREKETVKRRNGKIELVGMTNKGPYDVGIMLDGKGRVIRARFNRAKFTNDEWPRLTGFRHLVDLTCWHNFQRFKKGEERPDLEGPHPLSGENLIVFKDHPLRAFNIGGSSFNNLGLDAVSRLPNLRKIKAYHTRVTDEGVMALEGNQSIHFLNLGPQFSMRITERALESIGKMKALTELEFNETRVTWENGLRHLLPLKDQLKRVKLEKTWLDDGCLEKARLAFPGTTFQHSVADRKHIDLMKQRIERAQAAAAAAAEEAATDTTEKE